MKSAYAYLFSFVLLLLIFLTSCNKAKDVTLEEAVGAYVSNQPKVVAFGSIGIMGILEKAEYTKIPKFGVIAASYIKEISAGVDLNKGVYFALNGPFLEDGSPSEVAFFMAVKNVDSLNAMALKQGYDVEEGKGFSYFRDNDVSLAMQGNIAVVLVKNGDFEEEKVLGEIVKMATTEDAREEIQKLVKAKGDIHIVASLENAYNTSNTDLEKLSNEKKAEIKEMVTGSFVENSIYFEAGQIRSEFQNHFSPALNKRKILLTDPSASVLSKMGGGAPSLAFALNIDMRQAQAWIEDFSGKTMDQLASNIGGPLQLAIAFSGGNIHSILNGKIAAGIYAEAKPMEGVTPDFNLYANFGPNGKGLAEMAKSQMAGNDLQMVITQEGLLASTKKEPLTSGRIQVPQGCESFGKGGFTLYANFEKMDIKSFELEGAAKLLNLAKYGTIYFDQKGGTVLLKLKNDKINVLKQCGDFFLEEFASQIGNMVI